jgi:hypothetical protein
MGRKLQDYLPCRPINVKIGHRLEVDIVTSQKNESYGSLTEHQWQNSVFPNRTLPLATLLRAEGVSAPWIHFIYP